MKQTPFAPLPPTTPGRPSPTNLRPSTFQPPPLQSFLLSSSSFCSLVLRAFLRSEHRFLLPHPSNSPPCHCSPDTSLLPRTPLPTPPSSPPPCSLALPNLALQTSSVCLNRATLIQPPPSGLHPCPRHAPGPLEVIPDETTPSHNPKKVLSRIKNKYIVSTCSRASTAIEALCSPRVLQSSSSRTQEPLSLRRHLLQRPTPPTTSGSSRSEAH